MRSHRFAAVIAVVLGTCIGLTLWGALLGAQVRRHEPGLWTVRFQRIIECGLDYNGPPWSTHVEIWLSCSEDSGWQLWPPGR